LGKDVTTGAVRATKKEIITVDASNQVTLAQTPLTNTLKIYKLVLERDLGTVQVSATPVSPDVNEYYISGTTVTFNATSLPEASKVVCTYDYTSGATAQNMKITAVDFPNFITITGRGLVDDDQAGQKVPVSFKIHKAKVSPTFELSMASNAATELDFTVDCYTILNSANEREFIDIVKLNDEAY